MKKVIVYTTALCPICEEVKDYLKSKNVEFDAHDVSQERDKAVEMAEKSGKHSVPILDIGGEMIIGFDKEAIDSLLNL